MMWGGGGVVFARHPRTYLEGFLPLSVNKRVNNVVGRRVCAPPKDLRQKLILLRVISVFDSLKSKP